jgi:LCP family protein required for cell wall assembly
MKRILLILLGIFLAVLITFTLKLNQFYLKIYTPIFNLTQPAKTNYNILIFGYGGGAHEGTYLTDTIMLAHVDLKLKTVTLFSIPRDLWVKLPTKSGADFHMKINALYQLELGQAGDVSQTYPDLDQSHFGKKDDAEFTKYIVSQTFGLAVDNYVAIDFTGFKKAIDTLGGVDINVDNSFEDKEYPIAGKETDLCAKDEQFKKIEPFLKPGFNPEDKIKLFKTDSSLEELLKNAT